MKQPEGNDKTQTTDPVSLVVSFIFIAFPSALVLLGTSLFFLVELTQDNRPRSILLLLIQVLIMTGSMLAMLFGVGKWGQWRYLIVLVLLPIGFGLVILLADSKAGLPLVFLLIPILMVVRQGVDYFFDSIKESAIQRLFEK